MPSPLRHRARQFALQFLFQADRSPSADPHTIAELLRVHFLHFDVPQDVQDFAAELSSGTLLHLSKIDEKLAAIAQNWSIGRMSSVDRNILRLASFELLYRPDTPRAVVLNEAVELAKEYGEANSPAFVNGILDKIVP